MKIMFIVFTTLLLASPLYANDSHQDLQETFMNAMRANDAAGMAACYSEDAISYDLAAQIQTGPAAIEASWAGFFAANKVIEAGVFGNHIETHGDTGIAWGQFKVLAEPAEGGEAFEIVGRYSDVSRNFDGKWLYVMDHASLPMPAAEE